MTFTSEDARDYVGRTLYDAGGHTVGKIEAMLFEDSTESPEWAEVSIGHLSTKERLVPLASARPSGEGLAVPFSKETVKDAPDVEARDGHVSPEAGVALHTYYDGLEASADSDVADDDRYRLRPRSNETSFGTGKPAPGEPLDVTLQGTGNSAPAPDDVA
jgi:hypothetical protein